MPETPVKRAFDKIRKAAGKHVPALVRDIDLNTIIIRGDDPAVANVLVVSN